LLVIRPSKLGSLHLVMRITLVALASPKQRGFIGEGHTSVNSEGPHAEGSPGQTNAAKGWAFPDRTAGLAQTFQRGAQAWMSSMRVLPANGSFGLESKEE
jgi:hypothetical protein